MRALAVAWMLAFALALAPGCKRGASSSGLKIAVVPKGTTHEFWKSVHAGAVKAAREFDVDVVWTVVVTRVGTPDGVSAALVLVKLVVVLECAYPSPTSPKIAKRSPRA